MDPHPTPFAVNDPSRCAGKRRTVPAPAAAAAKAAAPKPKSIAAARTTRMARKSPIGNANAGPQPRPTRRAFGVVRSSNVLAEKPPPKLQKQSKVSPPPPQKPARVSPPPLQKHSKMSPPVALKPSKLSPPNPIRTTKPSRPVAKPLKKTAPSADLEAKTKKRGQRVSFQVAAAESAAPGSREPLKKATADDAAGHTPMVAMKVSERPSKVVAETPFFSAQNCSSCTLDQLESASYWLAQIRLAESVGKHWVAAAFFRLAFECQAQPIHRIQSELRNYSVRHESAATVAPLFDELLTAHGMLVNQPKFDTDGFEKVDTPLAKVVDKMLDSTILIEDGCLKRDCDEDRVDVGVVIVEKTGVERDCDNDPVDVGAAIVDKPGVESMEYPSFEKKLDESLKFSDCNAVIVGRMEEPNFDLQNNVVTKVPFSSGIVQSECTSSIEKLTPRGSKVQTLGRFSLDSYFDKKSPLSSKRLASSCPSHKKSVLVRGQSSKRIPSSVHSNGEHNDNAGVTEHDSKVTQDMGSERLSLFDQFESDGAVEDAVNNEIH